MSIRRTNLKAAETQQVIGSNEAWEAPKFGLESAFRRFGRFFFGSETRKATAETSVNQKQEADKTKNMSTIILSQINSGWAPASSRAPLLCVLAMMGFMFFFVMGNKTPDKTQHQQEEEKEDCETTDYCCKNSELPTHIVIDILSRLPAKTLLDLRLVCKDWLSLISEPYFASLHLSKSRFSLLFAPTIPRPKFNLVDLHVSPSSPCDGRTVLVTTNNLRKRSNIAYSIINSCNGLLCLVDKNLRGPVCICNPLLGELVTLPNCPSGGYISLHYCAFGVSPKTTQYKVIRSFMLGYEPGKGSRYGAEIYTLGEGSWRSMGKIPTTVHNFSFNAFLNGSLHWISRTSGVAFIYSFDFGSEQFRVVPEPSEFGRAKESRASEYMLMGVLQDCLSICDWSEKGFAKIWVMKDYGVKESWSKDFVIAGLSFDRIYFSLHEQIMLLGDDQHKLLITRKNNCLSVFNIASERPLNMHKVKLPCDYFTLVFDGDIGSKCLRTGHCIAHVPSLLSLKDVAKGECFEKYEGYPLFHPLFHLLVQSLSLLLMHMDLKY